jgi:predicted metal-dependent phosphoesterase TrpH
MIDLHTHTTASDGRLPPAELVARAGDAGVTVLAVTDHDTVAACADVAASCARSSIEFVAGIEISAVHDDRDVHILGYFIDPESDVLRAFLAEQRRERIHRLRAMVDRLRSRGIALDGDEIVRPAVEDETKSAGRPWIARALVASGHVATSDEAFDRWLERGRPAYVPRTGPAPADVIARIHEAGGVASLAHPALLEHDDWIPTFVASGIDALEAFHSDHSAEDTQRYAQLARACGLRLSGGSDFHGDAHGPAHPGAVSLPREEFERLKAYRAFLATMRASASGSRTSS